MSILRGRRSQRPVVPVAMVVVAVGMAATSAMMPAAHAADARTETDLFGYDLRAEASPVSVLYYEDFIPLPVDPGQAQFEMTTAYTRTLLGLGPIGLAVASNFWPGSSIGDGYGTVNCNVGVETVVGPIRDGGAPIPPPEEWPGYAGPCDDSTPYPYEARASYPGDGPEDWSATSNGSNNMFGEFDEDEQGGPTMWATALGLDVHAKAQSNPEDVSDGQGADQANQAGAFGEAQGESWSTVSQTQSISTALSRVSDISIGGGVVTAESIETRIQAVSDGAAAWTSGETTYSGFKVLGQPIEFTEDGWRFAEGGDGQGSGDGASEEPSESCIEDPLGIGEAICEDVIGPAEEQAVPTINDFIMQGEGATGDDATGATGITITPAVHDEQVEGPVASRSTGGVTITIDLPTLQGYLAPFYEAYVTAVGQVPVPEQMAQIKGYMLEAAGIGPKIAYVFGRAAVKSAASPGFTFEFPIFEPPVFTPPPPPIVLPPPPPVAPPPVVQPPPAVDAPVEVPVAQPPVFLAQYEPPVFKSLPLLLGALGLFFLGVPTWFLRRLREQAVGIYADAAGASVFDLRGGS